LEATSYFPFFLRSAQRFFIVSKGRQVYVEGRLTTREYEAKDGSGKRYRTEIIARQIREHSRENPLSYPIAARLRGDCAREGGGGR
jgi:hypothetical protein